jgi:hypothetical protein
MPRGTNFTRLLSAAGTVDDDSSSDGASVDVTSECVTPYTDISTSEKVLFSGPGNVGTGRPLVSNGTLAKLSAAMLAASAVNFGTNDVSVDNQPPASKWDEDSTVQKRRKY